MVNMSIDPQGGGLGPFDGDQIDQTPADMQYACSQHDLDNPLVVEALGKALEQLGIAAQKATGIDENNSHS